METPNTPPAGTPPPPVGNPPVTAPAGTSLLAPPGAPAPAGSAPQPPPGTPPPAPAGTVHPTTPPAVPPPVVTPKKGGKVNPAIRTASGKQGGLSMDAKPEVEEGEEEPALNKDGLVPGEEVDAERVLRMEAQWAKERQAKAHAEELKKGK